MKTIRILAVGRLKTPFWQAAAKHYQERIARSLRLEEALVRDAPAGPSLKDRQETEAARLSRLIRPEDAPICLDQRGTGRSSEDLAAFLDKLFQAGATPCFILGGAFGLADSLKNRSQRLLSLGPMTLPHELARVVLLEQIYRAQSILSGSAYHH
ncbi:MAG: 23S rRNA (pseudouridine(1915)-N(3))-methyltransferase RlmH [Deltaproteobacteria bacterium]|jgi:23S rRNA (pseudouridine1915-N3)-methyltransferase|nr:23S rRNA (pseudouridine(1915)-N(3))-methyltransferase RlmH [Deltaproteobacteria bacterium]